MDYLESAKTSLFRLEALQGYGVEREAPALTAYKERSEIDDSRMTDWWNFIERKVAAGVRMERVRVVSVPMTEYVQWELEIHRRSTQKGDIIKIMRMTDEVFQNLFDRRDFWLIDDTTVLLMDYDEQGKYLGFTVQEDATPYLQAREELLRNSVPIENFMGNEA